jgi:hypothetical protein
MPIVDPESVAAAKREAVKWLLNQFPDTDFALVLVEKDGTGDVLTTMQPADLAHNLDTVRSELAVALAKGTPDATD